MSKHTPGPWSHEFGYVYMGALQICKLLCGTKSREETNANARLIVAAPEMLEALEMAQNWLEEVVFEECDYNPVRQIKAAITKAKGEI